MLRIFITSVDNTALPTTADGLPEYRLKKSERLKPQRAKDECLIAGQLLNYALEKCFDIDVSALEYTENENGKPYIKNEPRIHFNITHTKGLCAVAISDSEVGIDAEYSSELSERRLKNIVNSGYFSKSELSAFGLAERTAESACKDFYRLWTAKESVVKCTGEGIARGFKSFEIPCFVDKCVVGDMKLYSFEHFCHTITVCSRCDAMPVIEYVD